jgi:tetratricopeptide (TPR) repeat protein
MDEMRLAVDILKGKNVSNSKEWAFGALSDYLKNNQDGYIMNVIGIAYLHGLGVYADTLKAIDCFERSGKAGYKLAYHNLGMYYKYAARGIQNFEKAYDAFNKGADMGSSSCMYNKGFMLYKGLGCEQNYAVSIEEFRKAADKEHPSSLYMLGLCYRNGYGVDIDTERAEFYLKRAASLGCSDAMEELLKEKSENSHESITLSDNQQIDIPNEMPIIDPYVPNDKMEIGGDYNGYLVTYDWSGKYVLSETPINAVFRNNRDSLNCTWYIKSDTINTRAMITSDGNLRFNGEEVCRYDRYSSSYRSRYIFDNADICYIGNSITGQLRLYSLDEQEPERPMYVCLKKDVVPNDATDNANNRIYSYPNPYVDAVTLKFVLEEDVPSARISLYSRAGINMQNYNLGALSAGEHSVSITPNRQQSSYVVYVVAGKTKYQTIIFKKH